MEFLTTPLFSIVLSVLILLSPLFLKKQQNVSSLSGLTTTFGILGTFIGIFAGLIAFNVNEIQQSVPLLLEGLKTAFLTSIAGMVAGILLRVRPGIYGIDIKDDNSQEGVDAVISLLASLRDGQKEAISSQAVLLKNIEKALTGEGDTTLLTQIQKLRTNFVDKQDEMIKEFRAFASKMAENNSKALIDALTQVMRDFNTKINEQFGENFKQLNQAVEKILVWQEKYKQEVEQMIVAFDKSLIGVEQSEKSLGKINTHAENFSRISNDLKNLLDTLNKQKNDVEERLSDFADVAKEAKTALPILKKEVNALTQEFTNTVSAALQEIAMTISSVQDTVSEQSSALAESQKFMNNSVNQLMNTFSGQMDRYMKETGERLSQQVAKLDEALGKELENSLRSLSRQLASLSSKFVEDYAPLTDRLRDVVQMSNRLRN